MTFLGDDVFRVAADFQQREVFFDGKTQDGKLRLDGVRRSLRD